jgi:hypothetical protein
MCPQAGGVVSGENYTVNKVVTSSLMQEAPQRPGVSKSRITFLLALQLESVVV